jgi:hypothetical protein
LKRRPIRVRLIPVITEAVMHLPSMDDRGFAARIESCELPAAEFNHRAHLRLAYVYLSRKNVDAAHQSMRATLRRFIECNGIGPAKYHETMTRAWIMAVRHFMDSTSSSDSFDSFIEQHPRMLDAGIMMTHYTREVLFSDAARAAFVEPDLDPIPRRRA